MEALLMIFMYALKFGLTHARASAEHHFYSVADN